MTQKEIQIAKILKGKLVQISPLLDFRVFGSRARGNAQEDSDLDIFIEVSLLNENLDEQIQHIAWEVGLEHMIFISVVAFSQFDLEHTPLRSSPLVRNIMEEGICL